MTLNRHPLFSIFLLALLYPHLGTQAVSPERAREVVAIHEQRTQLDQSVWKQEVAAHTYGDAIVNFWDAIRTSTNRWQMAHQTIFQSIDLPTLTQEANHSHGIHEQQFTGPPTRIDFTAWGQQLKTYEDQGWVLDSSEWHHAKFSRSDAGNPESLINFTLYLLQSNQTTRCTLKGTARVQWDAHARPTSIHVLNFQRLEQNAPPLFKHWNSFSPAPGNQNAQPYTLLYDLNRDNRTDIIFCHQNRWLRNEGAGQFSSQPLSPLGNDVAVSAGLLADVNQDGWVDYVCAAQRDHVYVFEGHATGIGLKVIRSKLPNALEFPSVLSAADIDQDGDLDLWLGQYKAPYHGGRLPSPYYDSNDGYPFYLLANDGSGAFTDVTKEAGLGEKQHRRVYSGSLTDLTGDQRPDLLVVSDFAGVDLYINNGDGTFTDQSADWVPERNTFGMSHTFGDFNRDGLLDFLAIGMHSTTANRLEAAGLNHPDFPTHQTMRPVMGFGNRLYVNTPGGGFRLSHSTPQVANSGWSWGSRAFDIDNDSDLDIYIANGHVSGPSAKDYCSTFWRHDIYTQDTQVDSVQDEYFKATVHRDLGKSYSWNGYEHNALFLKEGNSYLPAAFLLGIDFVYDSRAVLTEDFDNDGDLDLLVSEKHYGQGETFHVYQNTLSTKHNWVGVKLRGSSQGSPVNAQVTVTADQGSFVRRITTGDSFSAQHAPIAHFGLGDADTLQQIEVRWANGKSNIITNPAVNRYYHLSP